MLGTPSETVWPGVSKLRDWHEFPQWRPQDLQKAIPELDADGIDLMQVRLHAPRAAPLPTAAVVSSRWAVEWRRIGGDAGRAEGWARAIPHV
jgi:hypothetical protein